MPKTYEELLGFKKMQKVTKERLHPPMAPIKCPKCETIYLHPIEKECNVCGWKPIASEKLGDAKDMDLPNGKQYQSDSKLAIDFSYLTNNSSFQRAIIEFIRKYIPGFENVNPRASKDMMTKSFNKNISNYREVMAELKLKLQEKRVE